MITIKIARLKIIDVTLVSLILCIFAVTDILCEKTFWILEIFYIQTCKMYSRYPKKQTLVLLFHICPLCHCIFQLYFSAVFLSCVSQLDFSTIFLNLRRRKLSWISGLLFHLSLVSALAATISPASQVSGVPEEDTTHNTERTQKRDTKCIWEKKAC